MSARVPAKQQPKNFEFSSDNLKKAKDIIAKYPKGRQASAVIPLLYLAQRQQEGNWVSIPAMDKIGQMLDMPYIRVYEVATFYTMFNLAPVGEYHIQLCRTTPCWLRGSDKIKKTCEKKLGIEVGETTADGKFTLSEVECLGACVNSPVVQINDDFYEDLDAENTEELLEHLASGKRVEMGSQTGRQCSAPSGGLTSLVEIVGSKAKAAKPAAKPKAAKPAEPKKPSKKGGK